MRPSQSAAVVILFALLLAFVPGRALAAPGAPDPAFGGFGIGGMKNLNNPDAADALALQPDGKIVVVHSQGASTILARLKDNGDPDPGFGAAGTVITSWDTGEVHATAIAVQPDGRIVLAGYAKIGDDFDFVLARYEADGQPDTSFDGDGKVSTGFGGNEKARAMILQPDGKIVVAGESETCGLITCDIDFALARYQSNGALDGAFDGDGKLSTELGASDQAYAVALAPDGRLVAAGGSGSRYALAVYRPNGSLDPAFDGDGKLSLSLSGYSGDDLEEADGVAWQPDGKILVAGSVWSSLATTLFRLNPDGTLDAGFGAGGVVTSSLCSLGSRKVVVQPDGKIVVAYGSGKDFVIARYLPDGGLDTSFAVAGVYRYPFTTAWYAAMPDLARLPDGRLLIAGTVNWGEDPAPETLAALVRIFPDGTPDAGGRVVTALGEQADARAYALLVPADGAGRIYLGGSRTLAGDDWALARYLPDGRLDPAGIANGWHARSAPGNQITWAMAPYPNGRIVFAGSTQAPGNSADFLATRVWIDAAMDVAFNFDGQQTTHFGYGEDLGQAVAVQPDGKIVMAGPVLGPAGQDIGLARYRADGRLDSTFGVHGKAITSFGDSYEAPAAVAVQPDGRILVAGGYDGNFILARYSASGDLDTDFASGGRVATTFGGNEMAKAMYLYPDGRVLLAGFTSTGGGRFAAVRFYPDGVVDATFAGGATTVAFDGPAEAHAVAVRRDGHIVLAGCAGNRFAIAVLKEDGALEPAFGVDGKVTTSFGGVEDCARGVALDPAGNVIAGGYASDGGRMVFALAKYTYPLYPTYLPVGVK